MDAPRRAHDLALWFGLFGGPALWSVELLVDYGVAARGCASHRPSLAVSTFSAMPIVLWGTIVLAAAGTVAAGVVAFRIWRGVPATDRRGSRIRFMALGGVATSVLFLFLILMNGVPVLVVPPCATGG